MSKMIIINNIVYIDLIGLGQLLEIINIERLNIFCINNELDDETILDYSKK
jgi:hypothetical protein